MRVSSTMMIGGYLTQLRKADNNKKRLLEQADGQKLHRPSDHAVNYSKFLRFSGVAAQNDQYQTNVKTAISWMKNTDSALINIADCFSDVVEKVNQAANSYNNDMDMTAIAKEMLAKVQQAVSAGNVQVDDHYLISGQADLKQPFEISSEKKLRGVAKTLNDSQRVFFNNTDTTNHMAQMLTLKGDDGNKYHLNTQTGDIYTDDFMQKGYKDLMIAGRNHVEPTDSVGNIGPVAVKDYFKNTGEITTNGENFTQTITVNGKNVNLKFDTIRQHIATYQGDDRYISMVKQNGSIEPSADTVNVTGKDVFGTDIFDDQNSGNKASGTAMLNNTLAVVAKTENSDVNWLSTDGITLTNVAYNTVNNAETKLAARQQVYADVKDMLEQQRTNITGDISNVMDADIGKLAIELMTAETLYNMSLSIGGRILPGTLADYLH